MDIKSCFKTPHLTFRANIAFLLFRLIVGAAFLFHGWGKIQSPFSWMPPDAGIPGVLQFLAALSEFGGGLSLIIGLLVPLSMLGLACTMAVATYMHAVVMSDPFVNTTGGSSYELALVFFGTSVLFLLAGPGQFSLDSKIFGNK